MVYVYTQNGNPARHGHVDPFAWIPIKLDTPQHETWLTRTPPDRTPPDEGPNKAIVCTPHASSNGDPGVAAAFSCAVQPAVSSAGRI